MFLIVCHIFSSHDLLKLGGKWSIELFDFGLLDQIVESLYAGISILINLCFDLF